LFGGKTTIMAPIGIYKRGLGAMVFRKYPGEFFREVRRKFA